MHSVKPPRLKPGDLIGLVSPASPPASAERVERSVQYLERLGYRVVVGTHAVDGHGYLAGTDEHRAADLNNFFRDREVKGIFALRGGYGTPRILSLIDYGALRRQPKVLAGFSDITALQLAIYRRCRLVTFSGPMPGVDFWKEPDAYSEENFWRVLTSDEKIRDLKNPAENEMEWMFPGTGEGLLVGGNLSLVTSLVGTQFWPRVRKPILVLEDVDEAPYRIDRMLMQLFNAGIAEQLSGLIFGQFTRCEPRDATKPSFSSGEVLRDYASRLGCPVVANVQYGHVLRKLTIPFGVRARLDSARKRIEMLEAAVT